MKSENKLQSAINYIDMLQNYIQNNENATFCAGEAKKMLQQFLIDNMAKKKSSYDLRDYTSQNEKLRPVLNGICYDSQNKTAVACQNGYLLVVDRTAYSQAIIDENLDKCDNKGRVVIDKYGKVIDGVFPNYTCAFPQYSEPVDYTVDVEELQDYIKRCRAYVKTNNLGSEKNYKFIYKVGQTAFDARLLLSFAIATDGHITVELENKGRHGSWHGEDRDAVICCINWSDENLQREDVYGQNEGLIIAWPH